jgi:hypothetical protein
MTSTDLIQQGVNDLIQQRAKECRRLAAAARNARDKMFWLGLCERWRAVESRSARQYCLRQGALVGHSQTHSPGRGARAAKASPARTSQQREVIRGSFKHRRGKELSRDRRMRADSVEATQGDARMKDDAQEITRLR